MTIVICIVRSIPEDSDFIIIIVIISEYLEAGRRPLFLSEVNNFNTNIKQKLN